jgi:hypothetical protein
MARSKQVKKAKTEDKRKLKDFIVILTTLANLYEAEDDQGRAKSFNAAAKSLESFAKVTKGGLDNELKSSEDYENVKGVGKSTLELMDEFIETGKCQRLEELQDQSFEEKVTKRALNFGEACVAETTLDDTTTYEDVRVIDRCCQIRQDHSRKPLKNWEAFSNKQSKKAQVICDQASGATLYFLHKLLEHKFGTVTEEHMKKEMCHECEMSMENNHDGGLCTCDENHLVAWFDGVPDLPNLGCEAASGDVVVGDHTMDIKHNWGSIKEEAEIEFNCGKLSVTVRLRRYESNCDWKDYADISGDYDEMCDLCDKNDEDFDDIIYDAFDEWELRWVHE